MKEHITIGMVGAGRATELHMQAYARVHGPVLRFKSIVAEHYDNSLAAKERYGFEQAVRGYEEILRDDEIDVVDICTPPYLHEDMVKQAFYAGKDVICEKPLAGYFGVEGDVPPIGDTVSKEVMYEVMLGRLRELHEIQEKCGRKFMYAENFVYAPAIQKIAEMITKKRSRILFMKGEESLKGSSSKVAGEWSKTGGGTFTRTGSHPLSAILYLKQVEAAARQVEIKVESVTADMGHITRGLDEYDHRHIAARPIDVEDFGTAVLSFSDGSKAVVIATDTLLGGSLNYVDVYCNDAVMNATLTLNDMLQTFFPDEERLEDVYLSEMLPSKLGWNKPFLIDDIVRGYTNEMQDFMDAVMFDRKPLSDFALAYDTSKVIYAAYMSAEKGRKVML